MRRTLVPLLALIAVVVVAWRLWPKDERRVPAPLDTTASGRRASDEPAAGPRVPAPERPSEADSATSAPATKGRLVVQCVDREKQRPLARVRVLASYTDEQGGFRVLEPARMGSGAPGGELLTDGEGRATFEVDPGRALAVSAHDREHFVAPQSAEVPALSPGETRALRLEHEAGENARFCGLVVAREGGLPIAKAEVRVNGNPRTTTDDAGRFELDYAPHLVPALRIDAPGYGPAAVAAGAGHESAQNARRIALDRAASLVIALQLPETQDVARVTLRAEGYEISQDQAFAGPGVLPPLEWQATADAQWICRFEELPPNVRLVAEVTGSTAVLFHAPEPIVLAPGETRRIEWDLRGSEIQGHVYEENGKAAPGIALWLLRPEPGFRRYLVSYLTRDVVGRVTSAADGSFRFRAVAPGTWVLGPEPVDSRPGVAPADAIAPIPIEVTIRPGESLSAVDVRIVRGLYIRGRLVAPDGTTGVQGAVSATSAAGEHLQADAGATGDFALGPLARAAFTLRGSPYNTFCPSPEVQVQAGAQDVMLRTRPGAEVSGKVIDGESGAGVPAAITVGGEGGSMTLTRTQPDGSFRFEGLEPGRYMLSASTTAGQAGELPGVVLDAALPAKGLEVVLKRGARLRIRYEGAGVGQASVRRNGATIGGDGIEGGTNILMVVAPGRIAVVLRHSGGARPEVRELEIGPGEERELVFKGPAGK